MIRDNRVEATDGGHTFGGGDLDADTCADMRACRDVALVHRVFEIVDGRRHVLDAGRRHGMSDQLVFERRRGLDERARGSDQQPIPCATRQRESTVDTPGVRRTRPNRPTHGAQPFEERLASDGFRDGLFARVEAARRLRRRMTFNRRYRVVDDGEQRFCEGNGREHGSIPRAEITHACQHPIPANLVDVHGRAPLLTRNGTGGAVLRRASGRCFARKHRGNVCRNDRDKKK
jgi:hypothetical protein